MTVLGNLRAALATLAASCLLALSGCQAAGSMLVEVDVYKGPLTKGKSVQFGELVGVVDEADALLTIFQTNAAPIAGSCAPPAGAEEKQLCDAVGRARAIQKLLSAFPDTNRDIALNKLNDAAAKVELGTATPQDQRIIANATMQATRIATQLKVEAFYWAESQIGQIPSRASIRSLLVGYINLVSELSNQIASRTDTLAKQLDRGLQGSSLALSDHLKDAGPTEFLHLYEWYEATLPDPLSVGPNKLTPQDRTRLAIRLFSDHYWTRINQVHASGQGEVRIALIKDDIGNWNLKSFDNDPEKLLNAYRELTLAGIEAGIRVGKAVGTGGGSAGLELASQFARGRLGSGQAASLGSARIDVLRARAQSDLEALKVEVDQRGPALAKAENEAQSDFDRKQNNATVSSNAYKQATVGRVATEQKLALARQIGTSSEALTRLESDLDDFFRQEEIKRVELGQAQDIERDAKLLLDSAQRKHRDFMSGVFAEARKALEIHRRVIDGIKELQGSSPPGPPAFDARGAPGLLRAAGAGTR